jgi:paraquat-inducible protein B
MKTRALPKAQIGKSRFNWFLWLIPIAAALLCAWYVCQDIIFAGPTITIYFQNAEGLQEQNSLVQYRGVKIGEVETLKLTQDRQRVAVKVQLDTSAANIARKARFFGSFDPSSNLAL